VAQVLGIAVVFIGIEWLRGNWSLLGNEGLPWILLGYTQTPRLELCQIADLVGVAGTSFWVAMVNGTVAVLALNRFRLARVWPAIAMTGGVTVAIVIYGVWRIGQDTGYAGPTVLVIQPNYPQSNTGEKGAPIDEIVDFHFRTTRTALQQLQSRGVGVDLVVWSETMMPEINLEARQFFTGTGWGQFLDAVAGGLANLAHGNNTALLVGGSHGIKFQADGPGFRAGERRNTAYYIPRTGLIDDQQVYHKIHLVPFGEFIPFRESWPWMYRRIMAFAPPRTELYELARGDRKHLTVFELARRDATPPSGDPQPSRPWRFVTPICFEDVDPDLVADMFAPGADGSKRADFIVNITNDGWFMFNQMPQHLQHAIFRSIENRAPTARAVNTGISGFIDPVGRTHDLVPASTEGWSAAQLTLDRRTTLFSRTGDLFARLCMGVTAVLLLVGLIRALPRAKRATTPGAGDAGT
jgi:apolipoprotein N-acyltransferase